MKEPPCHFLPSFSKLGSRYTQTAGWSLAWWWQGDTSPHITQAELTEGLNREWHHKRTFTNKSTALAVRHSSAHVALVSLILLWILNFSWSLAIRSGCRTDASPSSQMACRGFLGNISEMGSTAFATRPSAHITIHNNNILHSHFLLWC